jgi:hypothetical protein
VNRAINDIQRRPAPKSERVWALPPTTQVPTRRPGHKLIQVFQNISRPIPRYGRRIHTYAQPIAGQRAPSLPPAHASPLETTSLGIYHALQISIILQRMCLHPSEQAAGGLFLTAVTVYDSLSHSCIRAVTVYGSLPPPTREQGPLRIQQASVTTRELTGEPEIRPSSFPNRPYTRTGCSRRVQSVGWLLLPCQQTPRGAHETAEAANLEKKKAELNLLR